MFWLALTVIAGCVAFFLTRRVYDRVGATRSQWVDYSLSVRA